MGSVQRNELMLLQSGGPTYGETVLMVG